MRCALRLGLSALTRAEGLAQGKQLNNAIAC